jgi:hypothetical protein
MRTFLVNSAFIGALMLGPDLCEGCKYDNDIDATIGTWVEVRGYLSEPPIELGKDVWRLHIEYEDSHGEYDCHSPACGDLKVDMLVCLFCVREVNIDAPDTEVCTLTSDVDTGY